MFLKKLNGFKNILTVTLPFVRGYVVGARHAHVLMDAPRIAKAHSIEWFKFKLAYTYRYSSAYTYIYIRVCGI